MNESPPAETPERPFVSQMKALEINTEAETSGIELSQYVTDEHHKQLSLLETVDVLWASFMFSQGSSHVQKPILGFVKAYYGPQQKHLWTMSKVLKGLYKKIDASRGARKRPQKLIDTGLHAPMGASEGDVSGRTKDTLTALFGPEGDTGKILPECFIGILSRDTHYLVETKGRPGDKKEESEEGFVEHPLRDKFFSYVVYYVLKGNQTKYEWANAMFHAMREEFKKGTLVIHKDLVSAYNAHHTKSQV